MDILIQTLDNGIRLVHQTIPGLVAHCGLLINTGSRDESAVEHGMAHFIEHMLFKGTKKRKSYHVLCRLEDVGGELNAYTTKEETAIHASFLKEDYERSIELISDIAFNSVFPEKEIEKEKDVVLDEINSYLDNPAELIFDDFEEIVFQNQPIGRNILGSEKSVKSFTRNKVTDFIGKNYCTNQLVFCSVGNISNEKILRLFSTYFSKVPASIRDERPVTRWQYQQSSITKKMDTNQSHCIIGNLAFELRDQRRTAMFLLNNIIGGQGLNSRLNMSLREKNGLAYNVESNYTPYFDTGILSIYFGTDPQNLEKSISITLAELTKLRTLKLGTVQLSKAKSQIKGYLARGFENHESLMLSHGKSILAFNRIEPVEEIISKIDEISGSDLLAIANEVLEPAKLSMLIYK